MTFRSFNKKENKSCYENETIIFFCLLKQPCWEGLVNNSTAVNQLRLITMFVD